MALHWYLFMYFLIKVDIVGGVLVRERAKYKDVRFQMPDTQEKEFVSARATGDGNLETDAPDRWGGEEGWRRQDGWSWSPGTRTRADYGQWEEEGWSKGDWGGGGSSSSSGWSSWQESHHA